MRQLSLWDYLSDEKPMFAQDHPILNRHLAEQIANYLDKGTIILRTTEKEPDFFDSSPENKISASIRTDGEWIWDDAASYYIRHYSLAPDREFQTYLKERNYSPRVPSEIEISLALSELFDEDSD